MHFVEKCGTLSMSCQLHHEYLHFIKSTKGTERTTSDTGSH